MSYAGKCALCGEDPLSSVRKELERLKIESREQSERADRAEDEAASFVEEILAARAWDDAIRRGACFGPACDHYRTIRKAASYGVSERPTKVEIYDWRTTMIKPCRIMLDGEEVRRVVWCVTGELGVLKRFVTDENGSYVFDSAGEGPLREIRYGHVKVEKIEAVADRGSSGP